jgi:hypothetical protein
MIRDQIKPRANHEISIVSKMCLKWIFLGLLVIHRVNASEVILTCFVATNANSCNFRDQVLRRDETATIISNHINTKDDDIIQAQFIGCSIYSIPSDLFVKFRNLRLLFMNGQKLHRIEPNTFRNAGRLAHLRINDNYLRNFEWNALKGSNLIFLNSMQNQLTAGPARGVFNVFQTHRRRRRRHSK